MPNLSSTCRRILSQGLSQLRCSQSPPKDLLPWLENRHSLTQQLQQYCSDRIRVVVLSEENGFPDADERRLLQLPSRSGAYIRQIRLMCGSLPVVYARTVVPHSSLTGKERRLRHIGTGSLGAVLFAHRRMQPGLRELRCVLAGSRLYRVAVAGISQESSLIWGRRSIFYLDCKPLLVSEYFLPKFVASISAQEQSQSYE